jgi:hypothetical protein
MTRNVTVAGAVSPPEALQDATTGVAGCNPTDTPGPPRRGREQGPTVEQLARAVALCHEDRLTDGQIAHRLGIARRTLARWKNHEAWGLLWTGASAYQRLLLDRETDAWAERRAAELAARVAASGGGKRRRRRR